MKQPIYTLIVRHKLAHKSYEYKFHTLSRAIKVEKSLHRIYGDDVETLIPVEYEIN